MKIGLFFGTFNPIHNGHIMMITYVKENTDIDVIQYVISPDSPFKTHKNDLISKEERYHMVSLACLHQNNPIMSMSYYTPTDVEFDLPKPTYTINTLNYIKSYYNQHNENNEIVLILGADNFEKLHTFYQYKDILENYEIYVINRNNINCYEIKQNLYKNCKCKSIKIIYDSPQCDLSSTFIRNQIKNNKNICGYVPYYIRDYIRNNKLYK